MIWAKKINIDDVIDIRNQLIQAQYLRLQEKTKVPNYFLNELIDEPANWRLIKTFFPKVKDAEKNKIHNSLNQICAIAINTTNEVIAEHEQEYPSTIIDMENSHTFICSGIGITVLLENQEIFQNLGLEKDKFLKLCSIIAVKASAYIFFERKQYDMAFGYTTHANYLLGFIEKQFSQDLEFETLTSKENKKKADKRWEELRKITPEYKKSFLEIMDDHNFSSFDECAYFIYSNIKPTNPKNGKRLSPRWIRDRLSDARKGDFS